MNEQNNEVSTISLYIPENVRRRYEIIDGFGKKEAAITGIVFVISLVLGILLYFVNNKNFFYLVLTPIVITCFTALMIKKDKTNRSTIDLLLEDYKFIKGQKKYMYKYHNIYEKGGEIHAKRKNRSEDIDSK